MNCAAASDSIVRLSNALITLILYYKSKYMSPRVRLATNTLPQTPHYALGTPFIISKYMLLSSYFSLLYMLSCR